MRRTQALIASAVVLAAIVGGWSPAWGAPVAVEPGDVKPEAFAPSTECGCHSNFVSQWSQTMHAQALTDPIYLAKLKEAEEATDGKLGPFCKKCHGPIATVTGEIGSPTMSPVSSESIGCAFCHHVVGLKGKPANTSQLVETDGVRRAQLKDPQAPHSAAYSEFHEKAEFCGGCHNVDHPVNGMHLEATYTEWKNGPYAEEGVACQDCHMSEGPDMRGPTTGFAAAGGPQRNNIYQMTFVGGQVALGPSELARKRLQSAATLKVEVAEIVEPGAEASVTVTLTNSGAGHYLPTGLTEVRQMWLEIYSEDAAGTREKIGERIFGTILQDGKGNAPVELWEAESIKSDDRVPPRESVSEQARFTMPTGADKAKVSAVLYYKSAPDELAEKAGVENPTTEMAVASADIFASEQAKATAVSETEKAGNDGGSPKSVTTWLLVAAGVLALIAVGAVVLRKRRS